jgi:hypothetical protein
LSGGSYPQCDKWSRTPRGEYLQTCTVTTQGNKTTLKKSVTLNAINQLVQMRVGAVITGQNSQGDSPSNLTPVNLGAYGVDFPVTSAILITMASQGNTPPVPSDFNRPDICNASNATQGENENLCTGTIPNICF